MSILPPNMTLGEDSTLSVGYIAEQMLSMRFFFYLVTPNETTYETVDEVPNFFVKFLPFLLLILLPELIVLFIQGKSLPRFGDAMCSVCCGLLIFLPVAVLGQIEMNLYAWCYDKFHIVDLPWNSPLTWVLCLFVTDLGFYIWHRTAHEVNLIWAYHQVHHTSQDFNMTIGIRLPTFNRYIAILFYLPCALLFPPSVFYVHYQLNYLFQFWIHSNVCPSFGWLDYILNSPSLHRVHHGRNRYCIDKNYGAVFSFWDVLFGTFVLEKPDEQIHYGLVHSINSYDPLYIQIHHLRSMIRGVGNLKGIGNKLSVFFKGPGWAPNLSRLGNVNDIPEIPEDKTLYDTHLPGWLKVYLIVHVQIAFFLFNRIKITKTVLSTVLVCFHAGYIVWAVACIGYFLEVKRYAPLLEVTRCAMFFILEIALQDVLTSNIYIMYTLRTVFIASTLLWSVNLMLFPLSIGSKKKLD